MVSINYACEGQIDSAVAERLICHAGASVGASRPAFGKTKLDPNIPKYIEASRNGKMKWLVLRDLDNDARCAPDLLRALAGAATKRFCLRIAVREIESWLLADARSLARFLRISEGALPDAPDVLGDPKQELVRLAGRSNKKGVKQALLPHPRSGLSTGPEYVSWMTGFAREHWDLNAALSSGRSPSLNRAVAAIMELVEYPD